MRSNLHRVHTLLVAFLPRWLIIRAMNIALSNLLRSHRQARRLSQRDLAACLGVRRGMVSKWEQGIVLPALDRLEALAGALGIPAERLRDLRESPSMGRPARHSGFPRRRRRRRPYPIGATVEKMLRAGGAAERIYHETIQHISQRAYRRVVMEFARDTRHELLAAFHALRRGARLVVCTLSALACPLFVLDDFEWTYGGDQRQLALLWEGVGERMVMFGQVRVRGAGSAPYRLDFLIYYKRQGRPGRWIFLELDGSPHADTPNKDASRAESVGIPEIRHDNVQTLSPGYFDVLLSEVRLKAKQAAEWSRDRRKRGRILRRKRCNEAEQRRAAA